MTKEPFFDVRTYKSKREMYKGVKEMESFGWERYFSDETNTTGFYLMTYNHGDKWLLLRVIEDGRAYRDAKIDDA